MAVTYSGFDQDADFEEGRPTDADALSPDFDHEVLEGVSGFDSETDTGSSLNDSTANPKLGTTHLRVDFDDATVAHGNIDTTSAGQTEGTVDVWLDPRDFSLPLGKVADPIELRNTAGGNSIGRLRFRNDSSDIRLQLVYITDTAGAKSAGVHVLSSTSGYVHVRIVFRASSGAGNDDGFFHMLVDDGGTISTYSATGIDNDTRVYDQVQAGMRFTNATTFGGAYDIDEIRVSESVSPVWITEAAALAGNYGAAFTIEDTTARRVQFTGPTNEQAVTCEIKIDTSSLDAFGASDWIVFLEPRGDSVGFTTRVTNAGIVQGTGTIFAVRFSGYDDAGANNAQDFDITDGQHTIRLVVQISSGAGNDDGFVYGYIDEDLKYSNTSLDNDQRDIDDIFGGVETVAGTPSGVFFMDDMKWSDSLSATFTPSAIATTLTVPTATFITRSNVGDVLFEPNRGGSLEFPSRSDTDNELIFEPNAGGSLVFEP